MPNQPTLRATLSDLAGRALDTFSETLGFVVVRDRHRWEERGAMIYHVTLQESPILNTASSSCAGPTRPGTGR